MTQEEIRNAIPELQTTKDLLFLLNAVKKDLYGEKCHPFSLKLLTYYGNPERASKVYRHFSIPKRSGGKREISAPSRSLKSILTCLNVVFQAVYTPSAIATGFIQGRSVVDNAAFHKGMPYIFNTDLKDFFPSIRQARVFTVLQLPQYGFSHDVASLISNLCCMQVPNPARTGKEDRYLYVLPQGSPASPILTNMICGRLDRRLAGLAKAYDLKCSRYADDITFSSTHNVYQSDGSFMKELRRIIEDQGFTINVGKTRLQTTDMRQEVTGVVVSDRLNVTREYTRSLGSILHIWERYGAKDALARFAKAYAQDKPGKGAATVAFMARVIQGKLMYMKMVKGEDDPVYQRFEKRFGALCAQLGRGTETGEGVCMSVAAFEREFGSKVTFKTKPSSKEGAPDIVFATSRLLGKNIYISLSAKCADMVRAVRGGAAELTEEKLKVRFYISSSEGKSGKLQWRITNGNPIRRTPDGPGVKTSSPPVSGNAPEPAPAPDTDAGNNGSMSLDSVLTDLVNGGFSDLSILDKWDRTNKS